MIEKLEPRTLFTAALNGGELLVTGTPGADVIRFSRRAGSLLVREGTLATEFPVTLIVSVRVDAGDGNDRVRLGPAVRVPATVDAGDGNDLVVGGSAGDTLSGGNGKDRLFGGAGADRIVGGPGFDRHFGGPGNDTLDSADGENDLVVGGPGRDNNNTYADTAFSVESRPRRPRPGQAGGGGGIIEGIGFIDTIII